MTRALVYLLICCSAAAQVIIHGPTATPITISAGASYLFSEDFEGTGYENSWTEDLGSPNEDDTSPVAKGSQSLNITSGNRITCNTTWSAPSVSHTFLAVYCNSVTVSGDDVIRAVNGTTTLWSIQRRTDNSYRFYHGTAFVSSATTWTTGAWNYIWIDYTAGSGSNGTLDVYISSSTTKPGSPTHQLTTGTSTLGHTSFYIRLDEANDFNLDWIRVSGSAIGSDPT